ncbi:hypothetical protein ACFWNK_13060 [Streptomyces sp. NPDC058417]|uniref:hypothetical protein n=1 Tax=unclassified Streptomyces TaxID=2593676 RepID=UPI003665C930
MGWTSEEYGESHEGVAGAVLADGSEPKPVFLDFGSGAASVVETSEWWAYDGRLRRPRAAGYRAACACGWRGETRPIDRERLSDDEVDELDTSDAYADWREHLRAVERRTVPLPAELTHLMGELEKQLLVLTERAPVAALKAVTTLERLLPGIGREAAQAVRDDELSWESVGTALGVSAERARSLLSGYLLPRRGLAD